MGRSKLKFESNNLKWKIEKTNLVLMLIFIFSLVTMRAVMNLTTGLMLLTSLVLFFIKDRNSILKNKWFVMLLLSYPLAILLNLFSPSHLEGAKNVAGRFYYPLLLFILTVNNFDYKYKKWVMVIFEIAMIIAAIWAIYLHLNPIDAMKYYPGEDFVMRVRSFESIGRWGVYLMVAMVLKYGELYLKRDKWLKIYDLFYLLLMFYAMFLNNGRGAWLGAGIGLLSFILLSFEKKIVLSGIISITLIFLIILSVPALKKMTKSIKSIGNKSEMSNRIRLETWQVGWDVAKENPLFGVGYDRKQRYVLEYREKLKQTKPKEYVDKYLSYSWVTEGSYVAIAAQNGFIYLAYYMGLIIAMIIFYTKRILKMERQIKIELLGMMSAIISYYFLQQFYLDLQSYSIYLPYLLFFLIAKKLEDKN